MNEIYITNTETTAGIGDGSVLPLGNVVKKCGRAFSVDGNRIKTSQSGTYHYNACISVRADFPVRVNALCDDVVVASATGKDVIPMAFDVGKGAVWFSVESIQEFTLVWFAVSAFGYRLRM